MDNLNGFEFYSLLRAFRGKEETTIICIIHLFDENVVKIYWVIGHMPYARVSNELEKAPAF